MNENLYLQVDSELQMQLELLKEKLLLKEKDIIQSLQAQKEEYERTLKSRDEEVTAFVDVLVKENISLKKQLATCEIELQQCKEKLQHMRETHYSINAWGELASETDKFFYENLKQIKETNDLKLRDVTERYDKLNRNLNKEYKHIISNLKKISYEAKVRSIDEQGADETNKDESKSFPDFNYYKDKIESYENKIKTLHEDLFNKDKYALMLQQKYEMVVEENKYIKGRVMEEKARILDMIDEIASENSTQHESVMDKIQTEILDKKGNLEKFILESLRRNEDIVNELLKDKFKAEENAQKVLELKDKLLNDIRQKELEVEELKNNLQAKEKELYSLREEKQEYMCTFNLIVNEKNNLMISNEDLIRRLNEYITKLTAIETTNKILNDSTNTEIEKVNARNKTIVDSLNLKVIELERLLRDEKQSHEDHRENFLKNEKRVKELNDSNEANLSLIQKLKLEISEYDLKFKLQEQKLREVEVMNDKLQANTLSLNGKMSEKEDQYTSIKRKFNEHEADLKRNKMEVERLTNLKEELRRELDDTTKANILLTNQLETLKISTQLDIQRLKNQISEYEKTNERGSRLSTLENEKNELKKEIKDLKSTIAKLYSNFQVKLNISSKLSDEIKMIEEIELGLNSFLMKEEEKVSYYEEEIKSYKKKISTLMQITNSVNNSARKSVNSNIPDSNDAFKLSDGKAMNPLYESIIIYLKNCNLKHLMEIFQINIQREEEIRNILQDKDKSNNPNFSLIKKQLSEISNNFNTFKKLCEQAFADYEQRAKTYVLIEDFDEKIEECKTFTQNLVDMLLNNFLKYKDINSASGFILFRIPVNEFNQLIEVISVHIDNFNKKTNLYLENLNKQAVQVERAIDVISKQTAIEYEVVSDFVKDKLI